MTTKVLYKNQAYDIVIGVKKGLKHAVLPTLGALVVFAQTSCDPATIVVPTITLGVVLGIVQNAVQFQYNKTK